VKSQYPFNNENEFEDTVDEKLRFPRFFILAFRGVNLTFFLAMR